MLELSGIAAFAYPEVLAMAESLIYTCEQARQLLGGMSKDTFWKGIYSGTIPSIKISDRKRIIPKAQFHAWLDGKLLKNDLAGGLVPANKEVDKNDNLSTTY